ncbi:MAG: V-type ATP synthase subunit D [Candidatus Brocadia sp.]|nr:V-type ATP synthase subunit D [Candidatus Brocadia sp.]
MKLQINATRMEFFKLRRRLAMAVRGHKLLKDKNEGLMKEFLGLIKAYKEARQRMDTDLPDRMKLFLLAQIITSSQNISTALEQSKGTSELKISGKSILNIKVPVFEVTITKNNSYSLVDTSIELDEAILQLKEFFPYIICVAELEQSIHLLAKEIKKIRRRINALEHVLIPQLQGSIKSIKSRLDEMERSNISRLMKIKEMLISKTEF